VDESLKKAGSERIKLGFEFFKHVATLSSGSILLVLALAERVLSGSPQTGPLFQSVFCFLVAISASLLAMGSLAMLGGGEQPSKNEIKFLSWALVMAGLGFFGGIAFVALAILRSHG